MKLPVALALLALCSKLSACPSPTLPNQESFLYYKQIFAGVVTGVSLSPDDNLVDSYVKNAARDKSQQLAIVSDGGPAYRVQVVVTQTYKGKAPTQNWLSIKAGCHNEAPLLLEKGVFAVEQSGELIAGYEHQTEYFDYSTLLHQLQTSFSSGR